METWALITPPAIEPVTVEEARAHRRVATDADDALLGTLIAAARRKVEADSGRALVTQTWDWTLDGWPAGAIWVPRPPLQTIDAITYLDAAGVTQVLDPSAYRVVGTDPALLGPARGASWPALASTPGAVTIRLTCGYGDPADVPETLRLAVLLLVGLWYENREAAQEPAVGNGLVEVPMAYQALVAATDPGVYR